VSPSEAAGTPGAGADHAAATWADLAVEARRATNTVADDPEGRLELRMAFYRRFGDGPALRARGALNAADPDAEFGYGRSELDFLRWEIRRGVLNPLDGKRGPTGSRWWREVNLSFLYDGELAALGHDAGLGPDGAEVPVAFWLEYIRSPGEQSWYRAHNASIVAAYDRHRAAALSEERPEQIFLNVVLYRLLYAQGMVEGVEFGALGRFLGNPRLPSVEVLVHLPDFYPDDYPLSRADVRHVMHKGHSLEEAAALCLDDILIHPHLARLYREAAGWNRAHFLERWVLHGEPVYPSLDPAQPLMARLLRWWRLVRRR
jgi:hypothetical protein